jgi:cytochrome P450
MAETIVRLAEQRQENWTEGEINLSREMTLLTLDVVGEALFFVSLGERSTEICDAITALLRLSTRIGAAPDETEAFHQANDTVSRIADEIIEEGRAKGENGSLLASLIASEQAGIISAAQLREEVRTFLLAGHVTTAQSLACAFWLMSRHPAVREKLEAEADQTARRIGEPGHNPSDRSPSFEDIPRLRFCEMVMLETLRIYPPVWVFGREALRQVELQGTVLRVGDKLVICPWLLHRNPAVFSEPEAFRPERWENDARSHLPRGSYLPFSTGARNCLGEHFAMMESTLVLASLARHWKFDELPGRPDPGWSAHLLYWPRRGIHLQATRRRSHHLSK